MRGRGKGRPGALPLDPGFFPSARNRVRFVRNCQIAKSSLPQTMDYEWTGMAYQEKRVGGEAVVLFAVAVGASGWAALLAFGGQPVAGPVDRAHFLDEQARHRRASTGYAVLCVALVLAMCLVMK